MKLYEWKFTPETFLGNFAVVHVWKMDFFTLNKLRRRRRKIRRRKRRRDRCSGKQHIAWQVG
jgi:hypothetical protein